MMAARISLIILVLYSAYIVTLGKPTPIVGKPAARIQEYLDPALKEDLQNITADVKQAVDEIQMAIADAIGGDKDTIDSVARDRQPVDQFVLPDRNSRPQTRPTAPSSTESAPASSDAPSFTEDEPVSSIPDPPDHVTPSTEDEPISSGQHSPVYVPSSPTTPTTTASTPFIIPLITDPTLPVESFTRPIPSDMRTTTFPSSWTSTRRPSTWPSTRAPSIPSSTRRAVSTRASVTCTTKKCPCHGQPATTPKTIQNNPKQNKPDEISITIEGNNYNYRSWQDWKTQDFQIAFDMARDKNNLSISSKSANNLKSR